MTIQRILQNILNDKVLFTEVVLYVLVLLSFVPILAMLLHGRRLPPTKNDAKDRNSVNRHLRWLDRRLRAKVGKKGIFVTEFCNAVVHALPALAFILYIKQSLLAPAFPFFWNFFLFYGGSTAAITCFGYYG